MDIGAPEILVADPLTADRLDHVGPGQIHPRRAADHEGEVGEGRRVGRSSGARPENDADLRDDAGGLDVAAEDPAVPVEGHDSLLDPRSPAVVERDDGSPGGDRQVHHLVNLRGVRLAQRAAEHREVLGVHEDPAAVDRAGARDHAVGVRPVLAELHALGLMAAVHLDLDERPVVQQEVEPLAGGPFAEGPLPGRRVAGPGGDLVTKPATPLAQPGHRLRPLLPSESSRSASG